MKNIFEQKLNKAIYFTKPVEFLEIRSASSEIYLKTNVIELINSLRMC